MWFHGSIRSTSSQKGTRVGLVCLTEICTGLYSFRVFFHLSIVLNHFEGLEKNPTIRIARLTFHLKWVLISKGLIFRAVCTVKAKSKAVTVLNLDFFEFLVIYILGFIFGLIDIRLGLSQHQALAGKAARGMVCITSIMAMPVPAWVMPEVHNSDWALESTSGNLVGICYSLCYLQPSLYHKMLGLYYYITYCIICY